MSAVDGAPKQQSVAAQLIDAQLPGEKQVQPQDLKTESSKDVQKERQAQFKKRHGLLIGFFGLIL